MKARALLAVGLVACGVTEPEQQEPPALQVSVNVSWRPHDCATLWAATSNYPLRLIEFDVGFYSNITQRTQYYESGTFQGSTTQVLPIANEPIASWDLRADGYHSSGRAAPQGGCVR